MDSAILSLLGAFLLSIMGLFVFIWSMRKGLLVENPRAASVIFVRGEIGKVDDPALQEAGQVRLQVAAAEPGSDLHVADPDELQHRVAADRSSAFPVFMWRIQVRSATQVNRVGPRVHRMHFCDQPVPNVAP